MRYTTLLLIITLSLFTINFAQDSDTSHHNDTHSSHHDSHHTNEEQHSNDHHSEESNSEHTHMTDSEEMTPDNSKTEHQHSSESDDNSTHSNSHSHHSDMMEPNESSESNNNHHSHDNHATAISKNNINTVMLGETTLTLYPLLSPQGDFELIVNADSPGYTTSVDFEDLSVTTAFDVAGITSLDLGKIKHGTYYLTFRNMNHEVVTSVSVYQAFTPSGKAFTTIFTPSPSLASKGQSEVFVYNIAKGENQHELINVNYSMTGMQHSTDDTLTPLAHEHFDSLKSSIAELADSEASTPLTENTVLDTEVLDTTVLSSPVLENAMSNRSSLSFPMTGTWEFSLMVAGETLTFDIAMLDQ